MLCTGFRMPKPWEESHLPHIDERWARSIRTLIVQGCVWGKFKSKGVACLEFFKIFPGMNPNISLSCQQRKQFALLRARLATNAHLYFVIWAMSLVERQTSENEMIDLEGFIQNSLWKWISWICLKEKKKIQRLWAVFPAQTKVSHRTN